MARRRAPKAAKEAVLKEYNHRCAICGGDGPQIHHIDEDPGNNECANLIPLCPNCHLNDQHNPTRSIDIGILQLFRSYKDPAILKPQFKPIYDRMERLFAAAKSKDGTFEQTSQDLNRFLSHFSMGSYYVDKINELYSGVGIEETKRLIVEMLRYQQWSLGGHGGTPACWLLSVKRV